MVFEVVFADVLRFTRRGLRNFRFEGVALSVTFWKASSMSLNPAICRRSGGCSAKVLPAYRKMLSTSLFRGLKPPAASYRRNAAFICAASAARPALLTRYLRLFSRRCGAGEPWGTPHSPHTTWKKLCYIKIIF